MNSAVGINAPAWLCIEAIGYSSREDDSIRRAEHPSCKHGRGPRPVIVRKVDGTVARYRSIQMAALVERIDRKHMMKTLNAKGFYKFRDGRVLVAEDMTA